MPRSVAKMRSVVKAISLVLGLLAAAMLVAGCGSSSGSGSGAGTATAATPGNPPPRRGPPVTVTIRALAFTPPSVTAHLGQPVHWVNQDNLIHNVIAEDGTTFESFDFGPGASYTYTPIAVGTFRYTCSIHPDMAGTLTIVR